MQANRCLQPCIPFVYLPLLLHFAISPIWCALCSLSATIGSIKPPWILINAINKFIAYTLHHVNTRPEHDRARQTRVKISKRKCTNIQTKHTPYLYWCYSCHCKKLKICISLILPLELNAMIAKPSAPEAAAAAVMASTFGGKSN